MIMRPETTRGAPNGLADPSRERLPSPGRVILFDSGLSAPLRSVELNRGTAAEHDEKQRKGKTEMGKVGWRRLLLITAAGVALTLVLAGASLADHNAAYAGSAESHQIVAGNPECSSTDQRSFKIDSAPVAQTYNGLVEISNLVTNGDDEVIGFDWELTDEGKHEVDAAAVIVKASNEAVVYVYDDADDDADQGLTTALDGEKFHEISHVWFCFDPKADSPPKLIVKKVVVGANNPPSDFGFQIDGGPVVQFEADGENLLEGEEDTYTITEPPVEGFTTTYDNCTDIELTLPQETVPVCTITNAKEPGEEPEQPRLIVKKVVVEANNPASDFSFKVNNGSAIKFEADGQNELGLDPGTYTVTEPAVAGFTTTYTTCNAIVVSASQESVPVCTITNMKQTTPPPPPPPPPGPPPLPPPPPPTVTPSIDVAIVKDATTPTQLNGTVTYTLAVTNVGGTTATDVQIGDPAPAGVTYTSAQPPAGVTCNVGAALVTCSRPGPFAPGASFTVTVLGKAIQTGTHINTATVTAGGGSEANLANNTDSAATLVVAPVTPPKAKPTPKPKPKPKPVRKPQATVCTKFTIVQSVISAGQSSRLAVRVTQAGRGVLGAKVRLKGPGVDKTVRSARNGWAITRVNAAKPGILVVRLASPKSCTPGKRVGVVGVFQPPVTG
jgi:uncharacterized repeat protein (TIGR01451 family)